MATIPKTITYVVNEDNGHAVIEKPGGVDKRCYPFEWGPHLAKMGLSGIASAAWELGESLVNEASNVVGTKAGVWVSGGTKPLNGPNERRVKCIITTTDTPPSILSASIYLKITD